MCKRGSIADNKEKAFSTMYHSTRCSLEMLKRQRRLDASTENCEACDIGDTRLDESYHWLCLLIVVVDICKIHEMDEKVKESWPASCVVLAYRQRGIIPAVAT